MKVLVYKTDIQSPKSLDKLNPVLDKHPQVREWSVDVEDHDHVLRMVVSSNVRDAELLNLVNSQGIKCMELPD